MANPTHRSGLAVVAWLALTMPAAGQWTYTMTNWSGRGARQELWAALNERWQGIGFTNLDYYVDQPGWFSSRNWIDDFDTMIDSWCYQFVDTRYVTNNSLEEYFASNPGTSVIPVWTYSNLLVYIGATNKPNNNNFQHPQFSNYNTNGNLLWFGASGYQFYSERKAALNELIIAYPTYEGGGSYYKTNEYVRNGYGAGTNIAAAQYMCETNYAADTNAAGAYSTELYSTFYTNAWGDSEAWMGLHSHEYVVTHFSENATQYNARVIWYLRGGVAGFEDPQLNEFNDNGIGLNEHYGNPVISNIYTAGGPMTWTSGWAVADSTNPLAWFAGGLSTAGVNHVRGVSWGVTADTYDYSVSNGFQYRP